jgi:FAD/FMN-containing dehydrogenase
MLRGELVGQGDAGYHQHRRVWNGSINRYPASIARCLGVADVMAALHWGRANGLPVAVRSGGHSFPGLSVADGALVIDLAAMKGIRVDPGRRTVRVQAGAQLGELDRETQAFGLAVPSGIVTHTGVAGLTLGGGIGWIMRKYGLSIDQLVSVDVVTASGDLVRASADENPDLFWGVRGAGANFGIVTEFEFRCVPLGTTVLAGPIVWPIAQSGHVLRFYRDWVAEAPDELMTILVHRKAPPLPFVPEDLRGKPVVMVVCCWVGDMEEGERFLRPLRRFRSPVLDLCSPKPFLDHQAMFDPSFPHGRWYYFKSCDVAELTDDVIDVTVDHSSRISSPLTAFPIWQMGGAVSRVGNHETAFNGRSAGFTFNIGACTESETGFDEERQWVRDFWSALTPWHEGVYVNFLGSEGADRVRQAYGGEKYAKLQALKDKYDPENVFHSNQNIPPSS